MVLDLELVSTIAFRNIQEDVNATDKKLLKSIGPW